MRATKHNTKIPAKTGFSAMLIALPSCREVVVCSRSPFPGPGAVRGLIATLALVATFSFGASPAGASQSPHEFLSSFGSAGSGAGQFMLAEDSGLAVDQSTGNVYLADTGNHRVDEFSESGAFVRAFGWGVATGAAEPQTCITTCQAGLPGPEPGQFEDPNYIAVDNTPGGAGNIYVADNGSVANERQTITVNATGGSYTLNYTSLIRGTTTNGSTIVNEVIGRIGHDGDPISGPGVPPGTTIVAQVNQTLELSAAATASASDVVLATTGTTSSIRYNATHEELQSALENLNSLEGGVCVLGSASGPYILEFCSVLAETNVSQMSADSSGLSGGTVGVTVATSIEGRNTARVQKFDSAGNLMTGWGGTPVPGEVDGTKCTRCGFNPHFGELYGVSVKPDGNLLVLNHEGLFSSPSVALSEWAQASGEYIQRIGTFGNGEPVGVAVDSVGRLYLGRGSSHPSFEIIQASYCQPGDPSGFCPEGPAYHENFPLNESVPATSVAVDPVTEDVYVTQFNPNPAPSGHSDVVAYGHEGDRLETFGGNGEIIEAGGIAVSGSTSDVYVADEGAGGVEIFGLGGSRDALTVARVGSGLGSVSSVPAGIACRSTCSTSLPEGEEVTLTAIAPEHSSFLGWSGGGCTGTGVCQIVLSADTVVTATFAQDPPVLTTAPASALARNTATVGGTVNPEGDASSCRFEYGVTTGYGAEVPCVPSYAGSGASPVVVSAGLWDLAAGATYHYRLVSGNSGGVSYGSDVTFTTLAESCASNAALCRALPAVVSPVGGAVVSPKPPGASTSRALTNAQKLARALEACRKQRKRSVRVSCEKQARRKYAPAKKKVSKSTRSRKRG